MLTYPELLAWENLWHDSLRDTYQAIYKKVKSIKPAMGVGWHIWHNNSFSPIYRAEQDLHRIAPYSDFLKIVMYHNCAGERMASYINSVSKTQYGDVPPKSCFSFITAFSATKMKELTIGFLIPVSPAITYCAKPSAPAPASPGAKTQLWPGIDIDIPDRGEPQQVHAQRHAKTRYWQHFTEAPMASSCRANTPR